ncbi:MAG: M23 family metallopeptidase [Thermoanaerobaculia bacterium]
MIEIQLHSGNLRKGVRQFVVSRNQVLVLSVVGSIFLSFMVLSLLVAPSVIRRTHRIGAVREMKQERDVQLARLKEHVAQISSLERAIEDERMRVEKLAGVYGVELPLGSGMERPEASDESPDSRRQLTEAHGRESRVVQSIVLLEAQLARLATHEQENPGIARMIPSILPLPADRFVVLSVFGERVSPFTRRAESHAAIDLAATRGTPIYATADGVVTWTGRPTLKMGPEWWRLGNVVVVNHGDRYATIYGHCDSIDVRVGQQVLQGVIIAGVGDSGWASSTHLHYEVRSNLDGMGRWEPVDPRLHVLNYQWSDERKLLAESDRARRGAKAPEVPPSMLGRRK